MRIATWNVNSVRQRLTPLRAFLRDEAPDVLCLQELKCEDHVFPRGEIEDAGYNVVVHGQKTFNGVAILSKNPIEETIVGLPGVDGEAQTRAAFQRLLNLGFTDALRAVTDAPGQYTFWDYQAGAWPKNRGLRIDHLLLSPRAADKLKRVEICKAMRDGEKPSDHVAIYADFID